MTNKDTIFAHIASRRSIGKLTAPAPSTDEINQALTIAMTAPDHHQLTPWRFVVLTSESAKRDFGQVLLEAGLDDARRTGETVDDAGRQKFLNMPNRAPVIIVAISQYGEHPKVPQHEQVLAMGACVQNLLLALLAQDYQSIWRSGLLMNHPLVQAFFNVADGDEIAGFIYVGSSDVAMPERAPVALSTYVSYR